jgi:hypothetical protein
MDVDLTEVSAGGDVIVAGVLNLLRGDRRRLPCTPVASSRIEELRRRYVEPDSYSAAWEALNQHHVLVLAAEPDSGAVASALHLIGRLAADGVVPHILEPDDDDVADVEQLLAERRHAHLLDLTHLSDMWNRFARTALSHGERLRTCGSYLVVRTTERRLAAWAMPAGIPVVQLSRPDPTAVVIKHLAAADATADRTSWVEEPPVREVLHDGIPPREAARLASLIATAVDPGAAVDEFKGWHNYLLEWFEGDRVGHGDTSSRALLLAAAALDGLDAIVVWQAADQLRGRLDVHAEADVALAGPGLRSRLAALDVKLDDGSIDLDQQRPSLDRAVLDYIWIEYPRVREELLRWMLALAGSGPAAGTRAVDRVSETFSGLVQRQADTTFLEVLAKPDTKTVRPQELLAVILSRTSCDAEIGRAVRRKLYDWVTRRSIDAALLRAIADACGGELGRLYPRIALTRLRHLARIADDSVARAVEAALIRLGEHEEAEGEVLEEVVSWCLSGSPPQRRTGGVVFTAMACRTSDAGMPLLLMRADDSDRTSLLVAGWRHLLRAVGSDRDAGLDQALSVWFDAVLAGSRPGELAAPILAAAAGGPIAEILLRAAGQWTRLAVDGDTERARRAVVDDLYMRVIRGSVAAGAPAKRQEERIE